MVLHIAPYRLISDIQKDFNKVFPFLKLEFFNPRQVARAGFTARQIIPNSKKICDSQLAITDGQIEIAETMKVKDLEKLLKDQFSLAVQVFRKSGNLWLETTMTDNWTLHQQNTHGREISEESSDKEKQDDYDLTRDADH